MQLAVTERIRCILIVHFVYREDLSVAVVSLNYASGSMRIYTLFTKRLTTPSEASSARQHGRRVAWAYAVWPAIKIVGVRSAESSRHNETSRWWHLRECNGVLWTVGFCLKIWERILAHVLEILWPKRVRSVNLIRVVVCSICTLVVRTLVEFRCTKMGNVCAGKVNTQYSFIDKIFLTYRKISDTFESIIIK